MSGNHKYRPSLTDIEIAKTLTLDHIGSSQRDIAGDVHRSKSAVHHALSEYDYDTLTGHNPLPKRARKTTKREDRYLIRAAKQFDEVPLRDITTIVGISVSHSTLSRRLHEEGLGWYVARRKPGLRPENVEERLNWAIAHKDWKRVIWSYYGWS
jgi:transposase